MSRTTVLCTALVALSLACGRSDRNNPPPGGGPSDSPENTDALCTDTLDNDGDGYPDCLDPDCQQTSGVTVCRSVPEDTFALCHDMQDNDNDGFADCADPDCEFAGCFENNDANCSDGIDNDDDGYADCDDFDCKFGCFVLTACGTDHEKSVAACEDNMDNDGDGFVDCADWGCQDCAPGCMAGMGEDSLTLCTDGQDNDNDGGADCRDTECVFLDGVTGCDTGDENTPEACGDLIDNDNDPWIDCEDRDCGGIGPCTEDTLAKCTDGISNDGDPYIDCQDFDCSDFAPCQESEVGNEACADGLDNDSDSFVDCDDFDCLFGCEVTVCAGAEKTPAECSDNIDNDGDNFFDCDDRGCQDCIPACTQGLGEDTLALCDNGMDDDMDGFADCLDLECDAFFDQIATCDTGETICDDGIDNDNDPWADCEDFDCRGIPPCAENDNGTCSDGIDNDGDGWMDCEDFDCDDVSITVCMGNQNREDTDAACDDMMDNDSDGHVDCDDFDCSLNAALEVCPVPMAVTIRQLQDENDPGHPPFPMGSFQLKVRIDGVTVTSPVMTDQRNNTRFFIQEAFSPANTRFSGIEVFSQMQTPDVRPGDVVNVVGFYTEYFDNSQILFGKVEPVGSANPVVATALESQQLLGDAEAYEGVLVELGVVDVTDIGVNSQGGGTPLDEDFRVLEASAPSNWTPVIISTDFVAMTPAVDDRFGSVTGPWRYTWGQYRLAPRAPGDYGPPSTATDDDDMDGLTNGEEGILGTNPAVRDTDGDGEEDLAEVVDVALPLDTDCDGILDALESSTNDADGDGINDEVDRDDTDGPDADPDGDGVPNSADANDDGDDFCDPGVGPPIPMDCSQLGDNCPTIVNNGQANADMDSLGDACDLDDDGDDVCEPGVCTVVMGQCTSLDDNCPTVANPGQGDIDMDGEGDACDPDRDGDGICEAPVVTMGVCTLVLGMADNCPNVPNPNQANNDSMLGDTAGDACDPDDDNDGVCDPGVQEGTSMCVYVGGRADNCQFTFNPMQEDVNFNGIGDACETAFRLPVAGEIMINEVLADPWGAGDANGDGTMDGSQDEFIELVNITDFDLTLEGCEISDSRQVRHVFVGAADPSVYEVPSHTAVVVFGGGTPVGSFGGATIFTATSGWLGLQHDEAESATLACPSGVSFATISTVSWDVEAGNDQSLNAGVDGDPVPGLVLHSTIAPMMEVYSPGTCVDGIPFPACL